MAAPDHLVIPDTQCKPGAPLDHLRWLGEYIVDRRPEVIVHLGDHWDLPSLSMYDAPGSLKMEGQRYEDDIAAGNEGMRLLLAPLRELQAKLKRNKERQYNPRMVLLRGNHEERVMRAQCAAQVRRNDRLSPHGYARLGGLRLQLPGGY
jgi:hypothetical protein